MIKPVDVKRFAWSPKPKVVTASEVAASSSDVSDEVFAFLLEYVKFAQKDAREDNVMASLTRRLLEAARAEQLARENSSADRQKREAQERSEAAMAAGTCRTCGAKRSEGLLTDPRRPALTKK